MEINVKHIEHRRSRACVSNFHSIKRIVICSNSEANVGFDAVANESQGME